MTRPRPLAPQGHPSQPLGKGVRLPVTANGPQSAHALPSPKGTSSPTPLQVPGLLLHGKMPTRMRLNNYALLAGESPPRGPLRNPRREVAPFCVSMGQVGTASLLCGGLCSGLGTKPHLQDPAPEPNLFPRACF